MDFEEALAVAKRESSVCYNFFLVTQEAGERYYSVYPSTNFWGNGNSIQAVFFQGLKFTNKLVKENLKLWEQAVKKSRSTEDHVIVVNDDDSLQILERGEYHGDVDSICGVFFRGYAV